MLEMISSNGDVFCLHLLKHNELCALYAQNYVKFKSMRNVYLILKQLYIVH
jgi:hypothetical protein